MDIFKLVVHKKIKYLHFLNVSLSVPELVLGYFLNPEEKIRLIFNTHQNSQYNLLHISERMINGTKHKKMLDNYDPK